VNCTLHWDEYLAVRRALGCKLRLAGRLLQDFVEYADRQQASCISSELAVAWATLPAAAQPAQWANRLGWCVASRGTAVRTIRAPSSHRQTCFPTVTAVPIPTVYGTADRPLACRRPGPAHSHGPAATHLCHALRLYVCTGLRANEPLRLDRGDVDLVNGVLTIRETKFGKSRCVPLHPSARRALQRYAECRIAAAATPPHPASSSRTEAPG